MPEQKGSERKTERSQPITTPGEPGRTPGTAEGDRETVEQSLKHHEEEEKRKAESR